MVEVVNIKNGGSDYEYIGRPSILGNPYNVGMGRKRCIELYEEWITEQLKDPNSPQAQELKRLIELHRQRGFLKLGCYCKPFACHGDLLKKLIEEAS